MDSVQNIDSENDLRWQSIKRRDKSADGKFFYSVKTTGVYCRPSCGARLPNPQNVSFFESCDAAEAAGFRSCKRCRPRDIALHEKNLQKISAICQLIEKSDTVLTLEELSEYAGLSKYHLHRLFKSITGLTPKSYAEAHKIECVRKQLQEGSGSVTAAILEAGFNSNSRFYEKSNLALGMSPGKFRAGGANTSIRFAIGECSLGAILVAASSKGICAIFLGDDPGELVKELQKRFRSADLIGGDKDFENLVAIVVGFVEKPAIGLDLSLDIRGTVFQRRVWDALCKIPLGSTVSYTDIAKAIGTPKAVRAVAQACGANFLAVAIPCHRVVRNDGGLSGYRWGVERKRALLEREASGSHNY